MKQFVNCKYFNAEKSNWQKNGHGKIVFTTDKGVNIVVGQKRHALKVMTLLEQGKDADAIAFANSSVVKSGYQHRDTLQSIWEKSVQDIKNHEQFIADLKQALADAEKHLLTLKTAELKNRTAYAEKEQERIDALAYRALQTASKENKAFNREKEKEQKDEENKKDVEKKTRERIDKVDEDIRIKLLAESLGLTVEQVKALQQANKQDADKEA